MRAKVDHESPTFIAKGNRAMTEKYKTKIQLIEELNKLRHLLAVANDGMAHVLGTCDAT